MPPSTSEGRHYHQRAHQFFLVLRGRLTIEGPRVTHELGPGQGIVIPAPAPHRVSNAGTAAVEFLVVSQPPSHGDREIL